MSEILCITNRSLCREDFLVRIEKLAKAHPAGMILREKDLSPEVYHSLAEKVLEICKRYETPCTLHTFWDTALKLGNQAVHLPLPVLRTLSESERKKFTMLGASCHSVEDAIEAQKLGCTYITAGHIYETDCKKGLPARGLAFLEEVTKSVSIPVYAIGGIDKTNFPNVIKAGAKGACVMSGAMTCPDPKVYLKEFKR